MVALSLARCGPCQWQPRAGLAGMAPLSEEARRDPGSAAAAAAAPKRGTARSVPTRPGEALPGRRGQALPRAVTSVPPPRGVTVL